jgi:hypothetical protein
MKNNIKKETNVNTKKGILIISWFFSLLFLVIGINSILPEGIGLAIRIENQIYWFVLSFATFIIPYISEITFKGFNVKLLKEMKNTQVKINSLTDDVNHLISSQINKSRIELIKGYHIYLENLSEEERYEKVKLLSKYYVEETGMSISDIKKWLKELGYTLSDSSNKYTAEFYHSLKSFQAKNGLYADGICGYLTHKTIQREFTKLAT